MREEKEMPHARGTGFRGPGNRRRHPMKIRRTQFLPVLFLASALAQASAQTASVAPASPHAAPVNQDATPAARALLEKLDEISGHYTLTGQHNFPDELSRWSDRDYDLTGKFPAIFGQDFGFAGDADKDSTEGRPSMIEEAERQYRNGAVIALTWHAVRPTDDEPVTFHDSVQGHLTDFEWQELLTPGTDVYNRWAEQVDVIAGYLRQLQEAGVPVLFRPYHEMNGNWFWWGGRPGENGSAALYRQLYDRFVHVHHLNNLIWVWNVNSPSENAGPIGSYFPGPQYVDVVAMDIYGEFKQDFYDDMVAQAGDKPIALAEVGAMPTLEVLARQPRWAYFMMWSGLAETANTADQLQTIFHAPNLLNRGDPPLIPPLAEPSPGFEPVTNDALPGVKEILSRLHATNGSHVLSGQENGAIAPAEATQLILEATGKYPAIYGVDLDTGSARSAQAAIDEAVRESGEKSIVSLRWLAPNPAAVAETAPPADEDSSQKTPLNDFDWQELMKPGTDLNKRWGEQVDAAAAALRQLQDRGIAVLWTPYPQSNGTQYWWGGRPGMHGSAALYRMLFDRLVQHDHIRNLAWVWEAAPPGFGPEANGAFSKYFPGLLYVDALNLAVDRAQSRFRSDEFLRQFAVGKVIGLSIAGPAPDPSLFARETGWVWFMLSPQSVAGSGSATSAPSSIQVLRELYNDPRVSAR
jgi:mannan endo-1,4-beta-mannosidase